MDENINQPPQEYNPVVDEASQGSQKRKIISLIVGAVVIIILVVLFLVIILPRFTSKEPKDVTLTYWGVWNDTAPFEAIAAEFTKQHPNIKVKVERQDIKALGKYIDRLSTRMQNGTGPDIFRYHNSWITEVKPLLLPLPESVVKDVELEDKFFPVVKSDLESGGAYYGVPVHFDTLALFINTQIFSSAGISQYPTTWDDVISTGRQLTVKDEEGRIITSGISLGTYDNISHAPDIISLLLLQNGTNFGNLEEASSKKSASEGLEFYTSFAQGDAKVWDDSLENSTLAFAKGNLAMYIGYSWDIFQIQAMNPNLEFTIIPVPSVPQRESTVASYWVEGVSSASQHPDEAFEFLKFLASKESMQKLYAQESKTRLFGELYPRRDLAETLKDNALIYPFVAQGDKAVSTSFSSDTYDDAMVDALNGYLANAVRSVLNNSSSAQSAIETLSKGITEVLGKYAGVPQKE